MGSQEVYKLKHGENEYDEYLHALKIATAKAEDEDEQVTIIRKTVNTYEDVAIVHPDGSEERLQPVN